MGLIDDVNPSKKKAPRSTKALAPAVTQLSHMMSQVAEEVRQVERLQSMSINAACSNRAFHTKVELEGRLGTTNSQTGRFQSGITEERFLALLRILQGSTKWSQVMEETESCDVFFTIEIPSYHQKMQVRSTMIYKDHDLHVTHVIKKPMMSQCFVLSELKCEETTVECRQLEPQTRIQASYEVELPPRFLPLAVATEHVRIKRRHSFVYKSGHHDVAYQYDLTKVYAGTTRSEAEAHQRAGRATSFEVEVECVVVADMLANQRCRTQLATSLLLKLVHLECLLRPPSYEPGSSMVPGSKETNGPQEISPNDTGIEDPVRKTTLPRALSWSTVLTLVPI